MFAISRRQFRSLTQPGLEGVEVHRTQERVFGQLRTIVVTFNQHLYDGQLHGLSAHLGKARRKSRDLQTQLQRRREGKVRGGRAPTLESVKKQIHTICSAQFVEKILKAEVQQVRNGLELTFHTEQAALVHGMEPDVSLDRLENPGACLLLRAGPAAHFPLQRELAQKGERISINRMLEELASIRETLIVSPRRQGQPRAPAVTCLTRITVLQQRLFTLLGLQRFVPATR